MIGRADSDSYQHAMTGFEQSGLSLFQPQPPMSSPGSILTNSSKRNNVYLPESYVPGPYDVICQRGKDCNEHVGNRRFRVVVDKFVDSYLLAKSRQEKSVVISNIVKAINEYASEAGNHPQHSGHHGGFIMKDARSHRWHHVDSKVARDKVGNALREAVKHREESSHGLSVDSSNTPTQSSVFPWIENNITSSSSLDSKIDLLLKKYQSNEGTFSSIHHSRNMLFCKEDESMLTNRSSAIMMKDGHTMRYVATDPTLSSSLRGGGFQQGSHYQSCPKINPSCFMMNGTKMMADDETHNNLANHFGSPFFSLEALAQSMDIDDYTADLEPRPIENMLRNER